MLLLETVGRTVLLPVVSAVRGAQIFVWGFRRTPTLRHTSIPTAATSTKTQVILKLCRNHGLSLGDVLLPNI